MARSTAARSLVEPPRVTELGLFGEDVPEVIEPDQARLHADCGVLPVRGRGGLDVAHRRVESSASRLASLEATWTSTT